MRASFSKACLRKPQEEPREEHEGIGMLSAFTTISRKFGVDFMLMKKSPARRGG